MEGGFAPLEVGNLKVCTWGLTVPDVTFALSHAPSALGPSLLGSTSSPPSGPRLWPPSLPAPALSVPRLTDCGQSNVLNAESTPVSPLLLQKKSSGSME